jgi:hypothetical protein
VSAPAGSESEKARAESEKPGASFETETASGSAGTVVLDASVLIGHLDSNDPHHARAVSLLDATDGQTLGRARSRSRRRWSLRHGQADSPMPKQR